MPRPTSVLRGAFGTGKCAVLGGFDATRPRPVSSHMPACCRRMPAWTTPAGARLPPVHYQGQGFWVQLGLQAAEENSCPAVRATPQGILGAFGLERGLKQLNLLHRFV
ncbi:hypothetical protein SETIT_7G180000v2 [Setaria italica]|uniref:Uncharacterized protein n=2 Tax=Setaria TaxID=4554 RepID=A0A368RX78_SETIT|nr:hypothetical protein SETIT_7G180000v2 [Setaria italica]TKW05637.1 hypothetical protein SEVIR_7G189700v2 [Setaria viridis]